MLQIVVAEEEWGGVFELEVPAGLVAEETCWGDPLAAIVGGGGVTMMCGDLLED